jgi:RNA polymerase sigma-70 factor (ECF subfamily)
MSDKTPPTSEERIEPTLWVARHGDCLFRYAVFRLADAETCEDLVQETFLAALRARQTFSARSSERTWLLGILKHKIADHYRRKERLRPAADFRPDDDAPEDLFDDKGRWRIEPLPGPADPSAVLERREFWETFQRCLAKLPARMAAAFALREVDGLPSEEVRERLDVSANNLWTLLHRARLGLGRCLDVNGFGEAESRRRP